MSLADFTDYADFELQVLRIGTDILMVVFTTVAIST
jgi:hypothetical protein